MHQIRHKLVQVVDSRHLHIALVAEEVTLAVLQRQHGLLVVQMDQILHVVFLGPRGLLAKKRTAEDVAPHVGVVGAGALRLLRRLVREPLRNIGREIVALLRFELLQQRGSPGNAAAVIRLIAEEA